MEFSLFAWGLFAIHDVNVWYLELQNDWKMLVKYWYWSIIFNLLGTVLQYCHWNLLFIWLMENFNFYDGSFHHFRFLQPRYQIISAHFPLLGPYLIRHLSRPLSPIRLMERGILGCVSTLKRTSVKNGEMAFIFSWGFSPVSSVPVLLIRFGDDWVFIFILFFHWFQKGNQFFIISRRMNECSFFERVLEFLYNYWKIIVTS